MEERTEDKEMRSDYLVLKWDDIEGNLDDNSLNEFYRLLSDITLETPEADYIVINTKETYANKVKNIVANGDTEKISKEELIAKISECLKYEDEEEAIAEIMEGLFDYINDKDIENAFEENPLC